MTTQPSPEGVARIRDMISGPELEPIRQAARMAITVMEIYGSQRGELEAALIARGWSKQQIVGHLPAALVIINEFGKHQ